MPTGYIGTKSVNETIHVIEEYIKGGIEIELLDLDHDLGDCMVDVVMQLRYLIILLKESYSIRFTFIQLIR